MTMGPENITHLRAHINALVEEGRQYFLGRVVDFTGSDGHRRRSYVEEVIWYNNDFAVLLWVPQIPNPDDRMWTDMTRAYWPVTDPQLDWHLSKTPRIGLAAKQEHVRRSLKQVNE